MQVIESIEIEATPEMVFAYLEEVDNRKYYVPALEEVIMIDPLPIKLGTRYTEVAIIAGRKLKTTYQITAFEKNKQLSAITLKSVFPIKVDLLLKRNGNSSILIIDLSFKLKGIFKLASGIVQSIVGLQARSILEKLKKNIEM